MSAPATPIVARAWAALRRVLSPGRRRRPFAAVFDATLASMDPMTLRVRAFERARGLAQPPHGAAGCDPESTPRRGHAVSLSQ